MPESIAADRQLPLAGLPLIGAAERERYQAWQGERVEPAPVESLVAAFDLRASLQPQAPALLDAHGSLISPRCARAAKRSPKRCWLPACGPARRWR